MTEPSLFSIWENLKKEKKQVEQLGLSKSSKKEVLIIDGYNLFFRAFTAIPTLNENGLHTGGMIGFLKGMGSAIKMFEPDRCIVIFDGVGGSYKRRKIYPDYKNHRKTKVRLNRVQDNSSLENEEISIKKQLERLVVYLQHLPVNLISLDNVEADDTIAYLALESFRDWNTTIMSSDKDFLQLVDDHIKVWSPTKKKLYGPDDVLNEYGIFSENFVYFRTLSGDVSDNIPPIKGCGLKTILKAFPILSIKKIDLNLIKEESEKNKGNKYKIYDTIFNDWLTVERNYNLMDLSNTSLTTSAQLHVEEVLKNNIPKLNRFELMKMITGDSLGQNLPNSSQWFNECFTKLNNYIKS